MSVEHGNGSRPGAPGRAEIVTIGVRAFSIAISFLLSVAVARLLGVDQAGEFFLVFTVVTLLATVGRAGTDVLTLKLVASGQPGGAQTVMRLLVISLVGSTAVAVVVLVVLPPLLDTVTRADADPLAVRLAVLSVIPSAAYLAAAAILRGLGDVAIGTFAELGSAPGLTVIGLVALALSGHANLTTAFAALVVASALTALWSLPLALRRLSRSRPAAVGGAPSFSAGQLAAMCWSAVLVFALVWAPVLVLGVVSDPAQAAYYTAAARIVAFVTLIPAIQSSYLAPRFARLFHEDRVAELSNVAQASARQALALGGAAGLVLLAGPGWLLSLFGTDFADAEGPLRVLAVCAVVVVGMGQVPVLLVNCGLEHRGAVVGVCTLVVGVVLMSASGLSWGALGVSVAAGLTGIVYAIWGSHELLARRGIRSVAFPLTGRSA